MNIKDFLEWRPNCFFCKEKLFLEIEFPRYPVAECEKPEYFIKDEALHFRSKMVSLSIDIVSGYVQSSDNTAKLTTFLARTNLEFRQKCLQCPQEGILYTQTAIYDGSQTMTHMKMTDVKEMIISGNLYFKQSHARQVAVVNKFREVDEHLVKGEDIFIPYLDLSKIKPESFNNKIRTCVTFS